MVAGLSLLVIFPDLGSRWFRLAGLVLGRIARRRPLAIVVVGLVSLTISAALSSLVRMPQPYAHDEFSYLLAGDTFAHGRLSNPTHPHWEHFETFHVIQHPTYASKYPAGPGLVLALGQKLGGHPIVGVWISTALASAAVCWMLFAWLPPRWALAGALLTALHPMVIEWSQSYWGASVALGGGALVLGALGRLLRTSRPLSGVMMALGMAVLAISRPYEGAVLCALVVGALLWHRLRRRDPIRLSASTLAAFLIVLLPALAALGFYNLRVTGHPFRLPYQVHEATYGITPLFIWQRPRPEPSYRHTVLRDFHVDLETVAYRHQQSLPDWLSTARDKYSELAVIHFPTAFRYLVLAILVLTIPGVIRYDPRGTLILIVLAAFIVGTLPEIFMSHRYTAPAASLLFLLVLRSLRRVRRWRWRGNPVGRSLVRVCAVTCVIAFTLTTVRQLMAGSEWQRWAEQRVAFIERLKSQSGQHLVLVRKGPEYSPHQEWVVNSADIDSARVVWAREMDPTRNRRLLEYFRDRQAWLLTVNGHIDPPDLVPYRSPATD